MGLIVALSLTGGALVGRADGYVDQSLHIQKPALEAPLVGGAAALLELAYLTALVASLKPTRPAAGITDTKQKIGRHIII